MSCGNAAKGLVFEEFDECIVRQSHANGHTDKREEDEVGLQGYGYWFCLLRGATGFGGSRRSGATA